MKKAKEAGLPHSVFCGCPACRAWVKDNPELAKAVKEAMAAAEKATKGPANTADNASRGHARQHDDHRDAHH
jgi:ABC-type nitrate/sulfonate/bicarbonate transport system substrate-binding protein